jgi:hypothetical protein
MLNSASPMKLKIFFALFSLPPSSRNLNAVEAILKFAALLLYVGVVEFAFLVLK